MKEFLLKSKIRTAYLFSLN